MSDDIALPVSEGIDFSKSTPAGTYNELLGGRSGFEADRVNAAKVLAAAPDAGRVARENFMFAGRAAAWAIARYGLRQVADVGVGIVDRDITTPRDGRPAMPSVEDCVHRVDPDVRVTAFDPDPVVLAHARSGRGYRRVLEGDVTDLDTVLRHRDLRGALDVAEPMLVILAAVLHFVADPSAVTADLLKRLAAGSAVVLSHATTSAAEAVDAMTQAYDNSTSPIHFRSEETIRALVDGWEVQDPPGLCDVARWGLPTPHDGQPGEYARVVGLVARRPDGHSLDDRNLRDRAVTAA